MTKWILSKAACKTWGCQETEMTEINVNNKLFICPVAYCESEPYRSKRACHKHVSTKYVWYLRFSNLICQAKNLI